MIILPCGGPRRFRLQKHQISLYHKMPDTLNYELGRRENIGDQIFVLSYPLVEAPASYTKFSKKRYLTLRCAIFHKFLLD
jgi:hypothetical protein